MIECIRERLIFFLAIKFLDLAHFFLMLGFIDLGFKTVDFADWICKDYNPESKFYTHKEK